MADSSSNPPQQQNYSLPEDGGHTNFIPQGSNSNINVPPKPEPRRREEDSKAIPMWILVGVGLLLVAGAVVGGVCGSGNCGSDGGGSSDDSGDDGLDPVVAPNGPTLARVRQNGRLKCGVIKDVLQSTISQGLSADLCRAVASAALGASNTKKVDFVEVTASDRFRVLQNGDVDMLAAEATHTMERDLMEPTTGAGFSFSIPYLYGGLSFAGDPDWVKCADELDAQGNCTGLRICVVADTTHVDILRSDFPGATLITAPSAAASFNNLRQNLCQVVAGEQFTIAPAVLERLGIVENYVLGENTFSKEPLSLVTRDGDLQWSDFVNWVLQGLLYAEEIEIKQSAASLLGTTDVFGSEVRNMFIDSVSTVGNYGEIYGRHLESIIPQANTANAINKGTSGLIYSMPFGTVDRMATQEASGTLEKIRARGKLWCGITKRAIFAVVDPNTGELAGQDVDFCRALSAAIFDGDADKVRYTDLSAQERFEALANGDVDVLSRTTTVTLGRDVMEASTKRGFSFAQPNFYDGLSFGGIPPFGFCADRLDTASADCSGLKICVNEGTTFVPRVKELFPEDNILIRQVYAETVQGLRDGVCNALAGGVSDVSKTNINDVGGYTGEYQIGSNFYTKDPLALVTRQDDQQWSSFVYWVVSAIFYAEEEGINRLRSINMPLVNLFGEEYTRMFRNAVGAVGHFGEMYSRNVESDFPRASLNERNTNPLGPQHYALPGI